jgi:hypothetical protein
MSSSDTPVSTLGTASGSAAEHVETRKRLSSSPHSLALDLFEIAAPHLTSEELGQLAERSEDVQTHLVALTSLSTLLAMSGGTLSEAAHSDALFVLTAGIESAAASLAIANQAAAKITLRQRAVQGGAT